MLFKKNSSYINPHDIITIENILYNPDFDIIEKLLEELSEDFYDNIIRHLKNNNSMLKYKKNINIDYDNILLNILYNISFWLKENCAILSGRYIYIDNPIENNFSNYNTNNTIVRINISNDKVINDIREEVINDMRSHKTNTCLIVKITPYTLCKYKNTCIKSVLIHLYYDIKTNKLYILDSEKKIKKIVYNKI